MAETLFHGSRRRKSRGGTSGPGRPATSPWNEEWRPPERSVSLASEGTPFVEPLE
jgi:hypothetical protein